MSNSFNISAVPELAAIETKIDTVDTEVDAIRAVDVPSLVGYLSPIRNDVTSIHDTYLPYIMTETGAIRNDVTAIHDTNLPAVKTDTGAIRNDVTDIKSDAAAIKLKTDLTPQKIRGHFSKYGLTTASGSFTNVCNITGSGKIICCQVALADAGDTLEGKITLDGIASLAFSHTGDVDPQYVILDDYNISPTVLRFRLSQSGAENFIHINMEFDTSCLFQVRRSAGAASSVYASTDISLDSF